MSCDRFERYDRGKIGEKEFRVHLETCLDCRKAVLEDETLLSQARFIKKPVEAPFLWTRIENSLKEEMHKNQEGKTAFFLRKWMFYPFSAAVLVLLCSGLFSLLRPGIQTQDLLADSDIRRIERRENRYVRSIERLEERTHPQMADLGLDLMLLYRDRIEIIDEQIAQCREALSTNSGNAHIRRYMLAAFQDKKHTLREIMRASELIIQEGRLE